MDTSIKLNLDLGKLYKSNLERTEFTLSFYKELYNLPTVEQEYDVTKELFEYCKRRSFFITILAFNNNKIFLKRCINERLQWELPGGSIRSRGKESFEDAASRILQRDIPKIEMSELVPIVYLKKIYKFGNKSISHFGLSVMGRVRNINQEEIEKNEEIKGRFVNFNDNSEINCLVEFEKKLLTIGIQKLNDDSIHFHNIDREIESTENISPYILSFHNRIVRPFGKRFSSDILKKEILLYIEQTFTVLDVACGDDEFLFELSSNSQMCVGNDVIWSQIKKMAEKASTTHNNLFFTNHDACNLPFRKKFDLTLCKNLLHHMQDRKELDGLFDSLRKVSKRILMVDPEDPKETSLRAKIWNWYYRVLLKDQGEKFYKINLFEQLIKDSFKEADNILFKRVKTIKGYYMFGYIDISEPQQDIANKSSHLHKTKAVIFDLDGLLVDTEQLFLKAIKFVLRNKGINITNKEYIDADLQNGSSILENLLNTGVISNKTELEELQENIYQVYFDLIKSELEIMPYAIDTINQLKPFFRLAIASSSKKIFIDYILSSLNIKEAFEVIISREDVINLKPHPECFHKAINELQLSSDECVVIEDSLRGVKAAQKVGVKVIVIPNDLTRNSNYEGAIILKSLNELTYEVLNKINN